MPDNLGSLVNAENSTATRGSRPAIRIALVNSMGDAALAITEQRFLRLIRAALPDTHVDFCPVTLAEIPRGEMAAARIARHYAKLEDLRATPPDAVIFTGAEPTTECLQQEIFWRSLTALFDWVQAEKLPSLFSCLAAHAAVLHFSAVPRRRLAQKAFGTFGQLRGEDHLFMRGMPEQFRVAHSRWNELSAADLTAGGYRILSSGPQTEVDMFAPENGLPQLYLQGHPEYEATALDGEYKRDVRRYHDGIISFQPSLPKQEDWGSHAFGGSAYMPSDPPKLQTPPVNSLECFAPLIRNWLDCRKEMAA